MSHVTRVSMNARDTEQTLSPADLTCMPCSCTAHLRFAAGKQGCASWPSACHDAPIPAQLSPLRLSSRTPPQSTSTAFNTGLPASALSLPGHTQLTSPPQLSPAAFGAGKLAWLRPRFVPCLGPPGGVPGAVGRAHRGAGGGQGLVGYSWGVMLGSLAAVGACPWIVAGLGVRALVVQVVLTCSLTSLVAGVLLTWSSQHLACLWFRLGCGAEEVQACGGRCPC